MNTQTATLDEAIVVSKKLPPLDRLRLIGILSDGLRSELKQDAEPADLRCAGAGFRLGSGVRERTVSAARATEAMYGHPV